MSSFSVALYPSLLQLHVILYQEICSGGKDFYDRLFFGEHKVKMQQSLNHYQEEERIEAECVGLDLSTRFIKVTPKLN